MSTEVKVPDLPESVADATVLVWHKQAGESVARDETIVELETDKVVLEVPAPGDGILTEILKEEGTTVLAQEVLAIFEASAASDAAADTASTASNVLTSSQSSDLAGPAARRTAAEAGVATSDVTGSGKHGRVTTEDVTKHVQAGTAPAAGKTVTSAVMGAREEQRVPMSRLRARVAERLVQAQHNAAMLTTFNEVDLKNVMDLRARHKDTFEKVHGVRLGLMSFFTNAVVEALKRFPAVNASIDGTDIIYHGYYDIGIAVSTERGLVVPVVRDADLLSMGQIEQGIRDYSLRARDNKLTIEEMTGGTFTITNGGVFGSLLATPIINPPQTGILGMHKIEDRPVVVNGEIVIRPMMYIALSYDHRLIDGKESVQFLATVKHLLEDPAAIVLGV